MAKINRYSGNLEPFASDASSGERTIFGAETTGDTLDENITADFLRGWGIVGVNENPTKQDFNALGYTLGQLIAYLHQIGIAEWSSGQEYVDGSIVSTTQGIYRLLTGGDGSVDPDTDGGTNWRKESALDLASEAEALAGTDNTKGMTPLRVQERLGNYSQDPKDLTDGETIAKEDSGRVLRLTGASKTVTLPDYTAVRKGEVFVLHNTANGNNPMTVQANGTDAIDTAGPGVGTVSSLTLHLGEAAIFTRQAPGVWQCQLTSPGWANVGGQAQSWQNVTASRSAGVTYTNTTSAPIMVSVFNPVGDASAQISLYVDGLLVQRLDVNVQAQCSFSVAAIVPPGSTYRVTVNNTTIQSWHELRQ